MNDILQWVAITVEFIGLLLVAIELYFPRTSVQLKNVFESTRPLIERRPKTWLASYIAFWVVAVLALSIWDTSMSVVANIIFSVFTSLVILLFVISRMFVRLGVALGRGNSVGGVGLVLALVGFSIEIWQITVI